MLHQTFRRFLLPLALTAVCAPALADPGAGASAIYGPGAGHDGGRIVFEGTPADLVAAQSTLTGQHLAAYVGESVAAR